MDTTEAEYAMLEWTEKLTQHPAMMTEADIQKLLTWDGRTATSWTSRMCVRTSISACG
jgi:alkylhydroperoxidase family enzyme